MPVRTKNINLHFMVDEREKQMIERRMEQAGIRNMRSYLLKMAVDGYVVQLDLSAVREMTALLRSVSNNMNQIAKRANETRSIYAADVEDLRERYDRLWEMAGGILKKLSEI